MSIIVRYASVLLILFFLDCRDTKKIMNQTAAYKFDFYTQYNQFYLTDKNSPQQTDADGFWNKNAFNERLAVEEGILGVGTESYGHIRGELFVLNEENKKADYGKYDHIVEAGLEIKSGKLQILDCPNSEIEMEIHLKPGSYCVRVYSSNLAGSDIDEDEGKDRYRIEIWPGQCNDRIVLKQHNEK